MSRPLVYAVGYDQPLYTAADWNDLWYHAVYSSYTQMRAPHVPRLTARQLRPQVKQVMAHLTSRYLDARSPYRNLSPITTVHTLRYMFRTMKKGVFIRIRNNRLDTFLPFARHNYTNDVYPLLVDRTRHYATRHATKESRTDQAQLAEMHRLEQQLRAWDTLMDKTDPEDPVHFSPSVRQQYATALERMLQLEYQCALRYAKAHRPSPKQPFGDVKNDPNRRRWLPNNHFFSTALYIDNPNVHHYRHLFQTLTAHRKELPDFEAVLQPRDYPVFRAAYDPSTSTTTVYQPFPDLETSDNRIQEQLHQTPHQSPHGFTPILSHTGKTGYYDVPLPTVDDIEWFDQEWDRTWFAGKCDSSYVVAPPDSPLPNQWVDWAQKTDARAVFRGSATGRGTTPDVNLRMRVQAIAQDPAYAEVMDVHLVFLNQKPKMANTTPAQTSSTSSMSSIGSSSGSSTGLVTVHRPSVEATIGPVNTSFSLDRQARTRYKYNLCLDGHTRADRFCAELCTGAVVILPTPDGHRLWVEPFLCPLVWEDRPQSLTAAVVRRRGYTHVTLTDIQQLGEMVRWLVDHDAIGEAIVGNTKQWLMEHQWLYTNTSNCVSKSTTKPAHPSTTSFLYDYLEGLVRTFATRFAHSTRTPFTLVPRNRVTLANVSGITGIVVGFRDSVVDGEGIRTHQLRAFQTYFDELFPASWKRVLVVAAQAEVPGDRAAYMAWWEAAFGTETPTVTVGTLLDRLIHDTQHNRATLPACVRRNLDLVSAPGRDGRAQCALAVGVDGSRSSDTHHQQWTRQECYRRTGEQKFNLGALKNAGYAHLRKTYGNTLSHVVFTDIDMLPDHELAPSYLQRPQAHEVIALAHRGTSYDRFRVDDMPDYVLTGLLTAPAPAPAPASTSSLSRPPSPRSRKPSRKHKPSQKSRRGGGRGRHRFPRSPFASPFANTRPRSQRRRSRQRRPQHHRRSRHHHHHQHPTQPNPSHHSVPFRVTTADGTVQYPHFRHHSFTKRPKWLSSKFARFLGASVSFSTTLFEAINGYPNTFWGWGGEDDALLVRLRRLHSHTPVTYTVPEHGRLIDLEIAQPVTFKDKRQERVKEMQKTEKIRDEKHLGKENAKGNAKGNANSKGGQSGVHEIDQVATMRVAKPDEEGVVVVTRRVEWVWVNVA